MSVITKNHNEKIRSTSCNSLVLLFFLFLLQSTESFTPKFVPSSYHVHHRKNSLLFESTVESTPTASNRRGSNSAIEQNAFSFLADLASLCLIESNLKMDAAGEEQNSQPSSSHNWVDEKSAFMLRQAFDRITLELPEARSGTDRDTATTWIRWMKSTPSPFLIDLTDEFRQCTNNTLSSHRLTNDTTTRGSILNRMGCHLLLLPSGAETSQPLTSPTGSLIFGKLLYGGVKRFRLLGSSSSSQQRRAGEQTTIKSSKSDNLPCWIQYGGPERKYEAVDMGSAALLEILILPKGKILEREEFDRRGMVLRRPSWDPQNMFDFWSDSNESKKTNHHQHVVSEQDTAESFSGKERNEAFQSTFQTSVGGLQTQIESIVRRVLDGRVIRPADAGDDFEATFSETALEAEELQLLGLTPVKGLLLYGPPGCGKTALAREISSALKARTPKIVSAPELLDRWVGGSEKLVRELFADAEAELAACENQATKSALHVIVIDEIDAVFRARSTSDDSGEATRSSVVNQILAKLDGVHEMSNMLVIGMTNRRELLDDALLRPGRLEVQIEIPMPDKDGRREILDIHFAPLRRRGRLSRPLCEAMDGVSSGWTSEEENDDTDREIRQGRKRKRRAVKRAVGKVLDSISVKKPVYDLASDSVTGGFSGADIAGLVRCAGSIALARARINGGGVEDLMITLEDVKQALEEVKN